MSSLPLSFPLSAVAPSSSGPTHRLPNPQGFPGSGITRVSTVQVPRPTVQNGRTPSNDSHQMQADDIVLIDPNVENSAGSEVPELPSDPSVSGSCYRSDCSQHVTAAKLHERSLCTISPPRGCACQTISPTGASAACHMRTYRKFISQPTPSFKGPALSESPRGRKLQCRALV
jgi:hypothetical protein